MMHEEKLVKNHLIVATGKTFPERARACSLMDALAPAACDLIATDDPAALVLGGGADVAIQEAEAHARPLPDGLALAALVHSRGRSCVKQTVICRADRADLRGLFFHLDARNAYGKVWLVGAGPGAADLITLRAQRVIEQADVVYHDDLLDEGLLSFCRGETVYVGKRKGRPSHAQDEIHRKLYRSAVAGNIVVRLKGGDPSIFGRGGEELDYLLRRWVRVEMVPGVTSASAAAAAGLFSLTRRQVSRSAMLLSGHGMGGWGSVEHTQGTFVYYMAASRLREIAQALTAAGVNPGTPVAVFRKAGFWNESCVSCTVETMRELEIAPPALVIAGNVAAWARVERKALFTGVDPRGVTVPEPLVHQRLIEAVSPSVNEPDCRVPSLYTTASPPPAPLDLSFFSAVVFSSPPTVEAFEAIYGEVPDHLLCYAIGDATREVLLAGKIHPWRIVPCPVRTAAASPSEQCMRNATATKGLFKN